MRAVRLVLATAVFVLYGMAGDRIPMEEFRSRRAALAESLSDGVTVLFGRTGKETDELRSSFFQEPSFYYLTGWREPGAILLLGPAHETLFLPSRDLKEERYTGRKASAEDPNIREVTGFENVLPVERFEAELSRLLEAHPKIYALSGEPAREKLKAMFPLRDIADAAERIGKLRLKKSQRELELIRKSIDASIAAHRAAWKRIRPGLFEYQAAATAVGCYLERGCERSAYPPIVASGPNATVLHYSANSRRMEGGELLLMDVAAECSGYAADITRTVPVDGKFTPRQRELYEIVLGAQKAAIAAVKPGMRFGGPSEDGLTRIAFDYINAHGKDREGKPLGPYFTHRVGHHVGLEVHDAGRLLMYEPLEAGMVITIEPGLYIPEEAIGIRIEDMLLVTGDGATVLSSALPKEWEEIEKALSR